MFRAWVHSRDLTGRRGRSPFNGSFDSQTCILTVYMYVRAQLLNHVRLFVTSWTVVCQVPLSMGILQGRLLEWVAMPSSRGSSQPRDGSQVSCAAGRLFYHLSYQGSPPRSECLLISWLKSPSEVILKAKKIYSVAVSIISPSICHEVMGPDAMIFIF